MPYPPSPTTTTTIRYGRHIWDEFHQELQVRTADTIGLFDKHNVIDEIDEDQATYASENLDRIPGVRDVLLSFGRNHRKGTFAQWENGIYS